MAKADDRKPKWRADLPLVVCKGGPRGAAWYFLDWWTEAQRLARTGVANREAAGEPGITLDSDSVLGYVLTDNHIDHPRYDGPDGDPLRGQVLLWSPDRGATRERSLRRNGAET